MNATGCGGEGGARAGGLMVVWVAIRWPVQGSRGLQATPGYHSGESSMQWSEQRSLLFLNSLETREGFFKDLCFKRLLLSGCLDK